MKRYDGDYFEKNRLKQWNQEHKAGGFRCSHCRQFVVINEAMGTANRNHCNICLWSKHVDELKGDRQSSCNGGMEPIGLTFKHVGYGKVGEAMFIHHCLLCSKININRVARDDLEADILEIYAKSLKLSSKLRLQLERMDIYLLGEEDRKDLNTQLFGNVEPIKREHAT